MLDDEQVSIKNKFFRFILGIFLFILVGGLILTLIPNDNSSLIQLLTGSTDLTAGSIGDRPISRQYYQNARRDCSYRYQQFLGSMKQEQVNSILDNCAYTNIKRLKVARIIGETIGFDVSAYKIKKQLSDEARQAYKQSNVSAGYSESEIRNPNEIYQTLLRQTDIAYRRDGYLLASMFGQFLSTNLPNDAAIAQLEKEADSVKLSLNYISFSDDELLKSSQEELKVPESQLKAEYDKETKEGKTPKNKGKLATFAERKGILETKLKSKLRQKKLTELKAKLDTMKKEENGFQKIASLLGSKVEKVEDISLAAINSKEKQEKSSVFLSDSKFMQDLSSADFSKKTVGGPYKDVGSDHGENQKRIDILRTESNASLAVFDT
ncbi:MAG: hypothetical protein AAF518_17090 [Spirochaetota bacterium]